MALENNCYPNDVRVRSEAETLSQLGMTVTVLAPRGPNQPAHEVVGGVSVHRYRLPEGSSRGSLVVEYAVSVIQLTIRIMVAVAKGVDVVHFHNPPDIFFPIAALARLMDRRVIFDHHDLAPELVKEKFGDQRWLVALFRWCEYMSMRCATVVISTNESYKQIAVRRNFIPKEEVVVVRNAPQNQITGTPSTRRGELSDPRLCYVGALGVQDGIALLPEILAKLVDVHKLNPQLTVVGAGPEMENVKRLARGFGVADRIHWAGFVPHRQVPLFIAEADICLDVAPCSKLNHNSTMIKIGEYMAAGRPIVTFRLKETIRTAGDCAAYADCGSLQDYVAKIAGLCSDGRSRLLLSQRALDRVRGATWDKSADSLRRAYELALR